MNKKELLQKLQEVNLWYFEQMDRFDNGELKTSTIKSYKTRHKQRRAKIIKEIDKIDESKPAAPNKVRGLFDKW